MKNLGARFDTIKHNEENRHDEFKFHNVPGKQFDSDLDSDYDSYIDKKDKEDMKNMKKTEKMQLKDVLLEPGIDYREQLDEIVKGFPKVKKVLNLNESISEWHDSQGNTASIMENDDQAYSATDKVIIESYQTFLNKKFGVPKYKENR